VSAPDRLEVRGHCPTCQAAIEHGDPMPLDSAECSYCQFTRVPRFEALGYVVVSWERTDGGWFATMARAALDRKVHPIAVTS